MLNRLALLGVALLFLAGTSLAWAEKSKSEKKEDASPPPEKKEEPPAVTEKAEILRRLETFRISMDFKDASLEDVIDFLREITRLNFLIDKRVYEQVSEADLRVTFKVDNLPLKSALKLILQMRNLSLLYREGVLVIVPKAVADEDVVMRIYDVRDLLFRIRDFPGPNLELVPPQDGGNQLGAAFEQEEEGGAVEDPNFILNMVKTHTCVGSWDTNPKVSISISNGLLIVTQTRAGHKEIVNLLNKLRAFK